MPSQDSDRLELLSEYWRKGQSKHAGSLIFENLPSDSRPTWTCGILKLVLKRSGVQSSLFDALLHTAAHRDLWKNGHRVFDTLRHSVLALDELSRTEELTKEQTLLSSLLSLAESVAKVTYNATNPPDEFDEDSAPWIAAHLRYIVDHEGSDDEFSQEAWLALSFVTIDPIWLTPTVKAVATGINADKAFAGLLVLADALQEAGCEHADLLSHLRQPSAHVWGCFALDLILGKE